MTIDETNHYENKLKTYLIQKYRELTMEEFNIWFAIVMYQVDVNFPCIADYWSKSPLFSVPFMRGCGMSRTL